MYIYIIIGIVLLGGLLLVFSTFYNKFQFLIIKMDEANNNIDILLEKKEKLLEKFVPFLEKVNKDGAKNYKNSMKHKAFKADRADFNNHLNSISHELNKLIDGNKKLNKLDDFDDLLLSLFNTDEELEAALKFYNSSVTDYNKLVKCFPSLLIALIFRYKARSFYTITEFNEFEILN